VPLKASSNTLKAGRVPSGKRRNETLHAAQSVVVAERRETWMKTDKYNNTHNMATPMSKTPEHSLGGEDETAPNSATLKKSNLKKKKQINYYISKEDLQHLIQNTRYSEQELRWILLHKSIS